MSGLLVKHGYEPIAADNMEASKDKIIGVAVDSNFVSTV